MLNFLTGYERPTRESSYDHCNLPLVYEPINLMTACLNSLCSLRSASKADFN